MESVKKESTQPVFDEELQQIFGSHYTDATTAPVKEEAPQAAEDDQQDADAAEWDTVAEAPAWLGRLKDAAKWAMTFGALSCLLFYWQRAGLMDPAAAGPSMYACALLIGWGVGKNAKK